MVLKAGLACSLHDGEECESTAMCVERVAADLMGLSAAVAVALKRELKSSSEIEAQWETAINRVRLGQTTAFEAAHHWIQMKKS